MRTAPGPAARVVSARFSARRSVGTAFGTALLLAVLVPGAAAADFPAKVVLAQTGDGGSDVGGVRAILDLLFLALALLLLVGGLVGVLALWYLRGRDPHTGLVAHVLPEPPDDLPPGAVGTLLDERADHHDVVATLVDLGHRRVLEIAELPSGRRLLGRAGRDFGLAFSRGGTALAPFEARLLGALFGGRPNPGERVRLSAAKARFDEAQPEIRDLLYRELVARRYFRRSPEATRRAWRRLGGALVVAAVVGGVGLTVALGGLAWIPGVAGALLGGVLVWGSGSLPRKTRRGSEAAARWRAFRRYLAEIDRYSRDAGVEQAGEVFDRYLPYAVAFGLERDWLRKFGGVRASAPNWYHPGRWRGGGAPDVDLDPVPGFDVADAAWVAAHVPGGAYEGMGTPDVPGLPDAPGLPNAPDMGMPDIDLQGMSDAVGGSLQDVSDGLVGLLDAAGSVFDGIDLDFS